MTADTAPRAVRAPSVWRHMGTRDARCRLLERMPPHEVHALADRRAPSTAVWTLAAEMEASVQSVCALLRIRMEIARRPPDPRVRLRAAESRALVGALLLIAQAEAHARAHPERHVRAFDAAKWLWAWLQRPQPALDGRRPAGLLASARGLATLLGLIAERRGVRRRDAGELQREQPGPLAARAPGLGSAAVNTAGASRPRRDHAA